MVSNASSPQSKCKCLWQYGLYECASKGVQGISRISYIGGKHGTLSSLTNIPDEDASVVTSAFVVFERFIALSSS